MLRPCNQAEFDSLDQCLDHSTYLSTTAAGMHVELIGFGDRFVVVVSKLDHFEVVSRELSYDHLQAVQVWSALCVQYALTDTTGTQRHN